MGKFLIYIIIINLIYGIINTIAFILKRNPLNFIVMIVCYIIFIVASIVAIEWS